MKGVISLKKRIIPLILLLAMLLSLSAYAASPRVMTILPAISFDGTTANCRVSVSADRSTDQISAVIQLWNGSTRIARWTDSGTGYLLFSNSATVSKGKTYVYQYFGFQEVDGHIEFMNTLNLMNPENDYLIFMDSSPLNAYQNEPAFILKSEFFGYIKTDHTDTLTLEGNYRDYNFSDLANYEFFSTSESVTKTLNYIRSELLKKFK